jgi:hypothetical protein
MRANFLANLKRGVSTYAADELLYDDVARCKVGGRRGLRRANLFGMEFSSGNVATPGHPQIVLIRYYFTFSMVLIRCLEEERFCHWLA